MLHPGFAAAAGGVARGGGVAGASSDIIWFSTSGWMCSAVPNASMTAARYVPSGSRFKIGFAMAWNRDLPSTVPKSTRAASSLTRKSESGVGLLRQRPKRVRSLRAHERIRIIALG